MPIEVNGRRYARPSAPTIVLCIDGLDPAYLQAAFTAGAAPYLERLHRAGLCRTVQAAMPTFTNPNNLSIVTGLPPGGHGIAGNYFYEPATGAEVMMNDPRFLRAGSIPAAFARRGLRVALVTAKDKLRLLLGHGLPDAETALCFSVEAPTGDARAFLPGEPPSVYSAAASEAVLAAGFSLLERWSPDLLYLSTTDYVQHKHAPGEPEADAFVAMLDRHLAAMDALGATIVVTADHGMNAKSSADGRPNVAYLAQAFDKWLPEAGARVVLPITDPYVRHHGALGSFATVHVQERGLFNAARRLVESLPGVERVLGRDEAAVELELPSDRIGDLCVLAARDAVLGKHPADHDLSLLDRPLRSHGGRHEQAVPLIVNRPPTGEVASRLARNFDAFDVALNGVEPPARVAAAGRP